MRRYASAVGVSTFFLPAAFRNLRRIRSSMMLARVASVPMPETSRSIFFAASSLTYLWISFMPCRRVAGVKRVGGFVWRVPSSADT